MATIIIRRREFTVTQTGDTYTLTGKRGSRYTTMRNKPRPEHLFLIHSGYSRDMDGVWLTDEGGALRVLVD